MASGPRAYVTLRGDRTAAILRELRPAVARALNRAIVTVETDVARKLAQETGIKQRLLKDRLLIRRASPDRLEARLDVSRRPIPLIEERGISQAKAGVRTPRGIIKHGFIATMKSGHRGAFRRIWHARLPIRELTALSLPKLAIEAKILEAGQAIGEAAFTKNLTHELGRVINRA